ncbi:ATP-dependent DNA helicase [Microbacterium invictum]|uniref:DNA 3'-5' helicase n=1 Tax=Microbacterium invictum TaxID=515415 RepID=A0ABZ0VDX8_9MICO|nr:ATP-dependent DNA helicase [Microbacterium invictum]WQB71817.1 ATP-dependent DNA helicase [Microbacterium invictum]
MTEVVTARLSAAVIAAALGQFPPTDEQTAVIESPLRPALVVAGAGSGKTETMAGRVVWLIANGFVRRDQVLGLTFTRKAAGELADRVQRRLRRLGEFESAGLLPLLPELHSSGALAFLSTESAHHDATRRGYLRSLAERAGVEGGGSTGHDLLERPVIATYNSFADQIVREHAIRIGRDTDSAVLSESAAWLLMRRVVLDSDDPRLEDRPEALRTIVDAALRIARDGADNLVDFDALRLFPERFADVLARPSEKSAVTVYKDVVDAESRVSALSLLSDLAREYLDAKRRRGVIDFSDQVAGALEVVRRHPGAAADFRDRFRVVLLDEYQDTSVSQSELLSALFAGSAVMAVGDPHQAIYGWRGASSGNLGGFAAAFSGQAGCGTYALMTSWRNSRDILRAAGAVLAPLAPRSPVTVAELRARPGAPQGEIDIAVDADIDAEAARVAEWFARVRADRRRAGLPTTGAILFRSKKHMVRFGDALGRRGIAHRILGLGGLLSTPEVVDVVSALRVISDPTAGSSLIRLLAGPRWGIGLADLRALSDLARRLATHDTALRPLTDVVAERVRAGAGEDRASLVDALDFVVRSAPDHGWLAAFTPEARMRLKDAGAVFAGLRQAAGAPLPDLIRLIEAELLLDIELAANETRGPARIASAQLRAFLDEVHAFLAADDRGSLASLLAWLDHAEKVDEFAPRTEPPEDDVVQLLTIHGSKGLEWDAVAVVRMVADELPSAAKDTRGWLGFGVLPYAFRGDAAWLPTLSWEAEAAPSQQDLKREIDAFIAAHRARQLDEDRRLAYVAVTRAREHLLLTASPWSGTKRPRPTGVFLREIAAALGVDLAEPDLESNPFEGDRRILAWPMDPLGARRQRVENAARLVREAMDAPPAAPDEEVRMLLAERRARTRHRADPLPTRIPASRYKDMVSADGAPDDPVSRPLPERPYRQTRIGTQFHEWVERRSGITARAVSLDDALWDAGDEADSTAVDELARLQERFLASEWAGLKPIEVETEIDFTMTGPDGRPHVIICKLDAVYRRGDRVEIVDWKTGTPPKNARERQERMVQLELYRRAYHAKHGIPVSSIDVALYYVADDLVLRG